MSYANHGARGAGIEPAYEVLLESYFGRPKTISDDRDYNLRFGNLVCKMTSHTRTLRRET